MGVLCPHLSLTAVCITAMRWCCRWLCAAGNEGSVDKLLKQIGGFMSDIAGGHCVAHWAPKHYGAAVLHVSTVCAALFR